MEETWQRNASDGEPSYVFAWTTAFFQPRVALPCRESVIEVWGFASKVFWSDLKPLLTGGHVKV